MNLQNGYKVIYEKAADGKRTFYASKTGVFADAEVITEATIGEYKLVYEKDGKIYGSVTGVPASDDSCLEAFNKVFGKAADEETPAQTPDNTQEPEEEPAPDTEAEEDEVVEEDDEEIEEDEEN